jgi:molecular chaperone IbpA
MSNALKLPDAILRSLTGFDDLLREISSNDYIVPAFPKYNILKDGDNYEIIVALAGYTAEDIEIYREDKFISIASHAKQEPEDSDIQYLHKGIANRSFSLRIPVDTSIVLDDSSAYTKDGLLHIKLKKVHDAKPNRVPIASL